MLAVISLAKKPVMPSEEYQDWLLAISMLAREVHDTIVDVESDKSSLEPVQITECRAL
ncbi:hypothetical protein [Pantoea agglomerans]|uniref:hypothetical protein n=1 Tax=Enterobacter agglomerans TaxID=549 RepID=UPI001304F701|nr:hypothetical protein [Pantoea agglomerans]UBN55506.1 hypothetical protein LB453_08140 [Pantoea agglomerans]